MSERSTERPRLVKLVRDRVGQFIGSDQGVTYAPLQGLPEHQRLLRAKLIEECGEYLLSPSLAELADVFEVIQALAETDLGVTLAEVEAEAAHKVAERGGFQAGVGMYVTTTAPIRHETDHAA